MRKKSSVPRTTVPLKPEVHLCITAPLAFGWLPLDQSLTDKDRSSFLALSLPEQEYTFHLKNYKEVVRVFSTNHPDWKVVGIPLNIIAALQHVASLQIPPQERLLSWVPKRLLDNLFDYQKEGVAFAISRGGKCMIADEMGVGKSRQGLALIASYRQEWPCLIICPSSLCGQWFSLVKEWVLADNDPPETVKLITKGSDPLDAKVNIISYDMCSGKEAELTRRNITVALLDESHSIKSRTSKRTTVLLPILANCKRVILLSGTPALSRPSELFTQLFLLRRDMFHNFHEFGVRYCDGKKMHFGWQYDGARLLSELNIILETTCMIRRKKDDVLGDLPEKTRECVYLQLTEDQHALIDKSIHHLADITQKAKEKFVDPITQKAAFLSVWRDTGKAKCPSTVEYVNQLLDQGEKFVLFAHHKFVLDELEAFLTRKQVEFIRIDGTTAAKHRTRQVDEFQTKETIRVALLSITAAGCGLTLTAAHIVVFAELLFTPGIILQAEDRCHRISQVHPVSIRFLLAKGTSDERVWHMLSKKLNVLGQIYGQETTSFNAARGTFEEDITQTDMKDFIAAILGLTRDDTFASTDLTTSTTTVEPSMSDTTGVIEQVVEGAWDSKVLGKHFKTKAEKITSHFPIVPLSPITTTAITLSASTSTAATSPFDTSSVVKQETSLPSPCVTESPTKKLKPEPFVWKPKSK